MTLCINLFGGPGIGKSTFAGGLWVNLKKRHYSTELPREYAKDLIFEGRSDVLPNQIVVLGGQWDRINQLNGKVDVIVNDSPVLLSSVYARSDYPASFHDLTAWCHRQIPSLNYVLRRHHGPYEAVGRVQDEATATRLDGEIRGLLERLNVPYRVIDTSESSIESVIDDILARLERLAA